MLWLGHECYGESLAWVTHVSESGHRLLLPLYASMDSGDLLFYRCGNRMLVYDSKRRQVELGPSLFSLVEDQHPWLDPLGSKKGQEMARTVVSPHQARTRGSKPATALIHSRCSSCPHCDGLTVR